MKNYTPKAGDVWERGRERITLDSKHGISGPDWWHYRSTRKLFAKGHYDLGKFTRGIDPNSLARDGWTLINPSPTPK